MLRRDWGRFGCAIVAVLCIGVVLWSRPRADPVSAKAPVMGAAGAIRFVEVATRPLAGALPAVVRALDGASGLSIAQPGVCHTTGRLDCPEGAIAPAGLGTTTHSVWPIPHPTEANRWAIPMPLAAAVVYAVIRAGCIARVDAGAQGACTVIAQFPPVEAALDASWTPSDDAGPSLSPDVPDDFPNETP